MSASDENDPQMTGITQMTRATNEEVRDPRTYAIIGAAMEVHNQLGCGFLEPVYQAALAMKFEERGIPFRAETELPLCYKGQCLDVSYRADFICFESVLVELKALRRIGGVEEAQVINYLKATGLYVGLLLNFGAPSLEHRRFVLTKLQSASSAKSVDNMGVCGSGRTR